MNLRAATIADAPAMAGAHARGFDSPWVAAAFAGLMDDPGVFGLVVEEGPAIAGLILVRSVADEAEILTICVDPAFRRQGLGAALIDVAISLAAQAGAERMFLEVADDNDAALAAYAQAGFTKAGRRPGYYARPGGRAVDALILRAELNTRLA